MKNSTICLMQALAKDDAYKNQPSCKVLEITAFASHTKCYLESGFCDAILDNFANMQCLDSVLNGQDPIIKVGIEQVIKITNLTLIKSLNLAYSVNIYTGNAIKVNTVNIIERSNQHKDHIKNKILNLYQYRL